MIDIPFKTQPVAAFYKLLAKNFIFILCLSLLISTLVFTILKLIIINSLGSGGIKEIVQLYETKPTDVMAQSKAMQSFIIKYPKFISAIMGSSFLVLLFISYMFFITQQFLKNKSFDLNQKILTILKPDMRYLKIVFYLICIGAIFFFISGFVVLGIAANPLIGSFAGIFLAMVIIRNCLVIPGLIIGEMNLLDSLKYSFQTISLGRSFKIMIFGSIIFLLLWLIFSALFYFPSVWFTTNSFNLYFNILILYLLIGCISLGTAALFIRYGNFDEEKITE